MFRLLNNRVGHLGVLVLVSAALNLPNLGGPSLWDVDEGRNSACARDMLESGDYVLPRFNGELRPDKPALLYWLQAGAYSVFGVGEFAARLPSALAAMLTVLLTYAIGRRLFDAITGLIAGIVLASAPLFCAAGHFANPDALLNACTVLTFLFFWLAYSRANSRWLIAAGIATGLGVLAKGPVAIALPFAACTLFLLGSRRLGFLWDWRLLWASLACVLVFGPWYTWVGVETKAEFLRDFLLTHNVDRFLHPMQNHSGAPGYGPRLLALAAQAAYYPVVLLVGLAPWSAFLTPAICHACGRRAHADATTNQTNDLRPAYRFLWCWIAVYMVFFSLAGTKLPNYVLPMYAPAALLLARFLERWRRGAVDPSRWLLYGSLSVFALFGLVLAAVLLLVGCAVPVSGVKLPPLPGVAFWALAGGLLAAGAGAAWWLVRRHSRGLALASLCAAAIACVACLAARGTTAVDQSKAPRSLVQSILQEQSEPEIRVVCYNYFQPSLVFYSGREIPVLLSDAQALELLRYPVEVFLILPASDWQRLHGQVRTPTRLVAEHRDLYRQCDVVVVTNR